MGTTDLAASYLEHMYTLTPHLLEPLSKRVAVEGKERVYVEPWLQVRAPEVVRIAGSRREEQECCRVFVPYPRCLICDGPCLVRRRKSSKSIGHASTFFCKAVQRGHLNVTRIHGSK